MPFGPKTNLKTVFCSLPLRNPKKTLKTNSKSFSLEVNTMLPYSWLSFLSHTRDHRRPRFRAQEQRFRVGSPPGQAGVGLGGQVDLEKKVINSPEGPQNGWVLSSLKAPQNGWSFKRPRGLRASKKVFIS